MITCKIIDNLFVCLFVCLLSPISTILIRPTQSVTISTRFYYAPEIKDRGAYCCFCPVCCNVLSLPIELCLYQYLLAHEFA